MNTLKKISQRISQRIFLVAIACSQVWLPAAIAQNKPSQKAIAPQPILSECYIKTANGRIVNLGALCGDTNPINVRSNSKGVFQAQIKRRANGIPVIDVIFTTKGFTGKFEMMVDTGASSTVVTTQMAKALGITVVSKAMVNTASANNVEIPLGYVRSMEVNGVVAEDILVGIIPALDIGLLGHDFFRDYDITVKKNVIEFRVPTK